MLYQIIEPIILMITDLLRPLSSPIILEFQEYSLSLAIKVIKEGSHLGNSESMASTIQSVLGSAQALGAWHV